MVRTQIDLDEHQRRRLADRAAADGTSVSELIRRAVNAELDKPEVDGEWRNRWSLAVATTSGVAPLLPPGVEYRPCQLSWPYGYNMHVARRQTLVQLSDDLVESLSAEARRFGLSRSALIRQVLTDYLAERAEDAIGRQIAEGYRRVPPGTPDEWGDLSAFADQAFIETAQRLHAEEVEAGLEPW